MQAVPEEQVIATGSLHSCISPRAKKAAPLSSTTVNSSKKLSCSNEATKGLCLDQGETTTFLILNFFKRAISSNVIGLLAYILFADILFFVD